MLSSSEKALSRLRGYTRFVNIESVPKNKPTEHKNKKKSRKSRKPRRKVVEKKNKPQKKIKALETADSDSGSDGV